MRIIDSFNLCALSYVGIGPSVRMILIESNEDAGPHLKNMKILGNCSNILFSKDHYEIDFARLDGDFRKMFVIDQENGIVRAGAGMSVNSLILQCAEHDMGGMEELYGIPGTVGGMLKCNAGAYSSEIKDNLISIVTVSGNVKAEEIKFGYRSCSIDETVLFAEFRMMHRKKADIIETVRKYRKERTERMPTGRSLGSVFKNPSPDIKAWSLIDMNGFRNKCVNDICVSDRHTNIIINRGAGTAQDFLALTQEIIDTVKKNNGIQLEYEIEIF